MKILYVLPILLALPMTTLAAEKKTTVTDTKSCQTATKVSLWDNTYIRPFIAYNIGLADTARIKYEANNQQFATSTTYAFNSDNTGDIVAGIEVDDVMALSINPQFSKTKTKYNNGTEETVKANEIDAKLDIYLMRKVEYIPYVSFSVGHISLDGDIQASGAMSGISIGCKHYVNDHVYFDANAGYKISTDMRLKKVNNTNVPDGSIRISGFDLNIGVGYRF